MRTLSTVADYCRVIRQCCNRPVWLLSEERREHFGTVYAVQIDPRGLRLHYSMGLDDSSVVWRCNLAIARAVIKALGLSLMECGRDDYATVGLLLHGLKYAPSPMARCRTSCDSKGNISLTYFG